MRWRLCCRDAPVGFKSSKKLFLAALFPSVERAEDKKGKGALTGGGRGSHIHMLHFPRGVGELASHAGILQVHHPPVILVYKVCSKAIE